MNTRPTQPSTRRARAVNTSEKPIPTPSGSADGGEPFLKLSDRLPQGTDLPIATGHSSRVAAGDGRGSSDPSRRSPWVQRGLGQQLELFQAGLELPFVRLGSDQLPVDTHRSVQMTLGSVQLGEGSGGQARLGRLGGHSGARPRLFMFCCRKRWNRSGRIRGYRYPSEIQNLPGLPFEDGRDRLLLEFFLHGARVVGNRLRGSDLLSLTRGEDRCWLMRRRDGRRSALFAGRGIGIRGWERSGGLRGSHRRLHRAQAPLPAGGGRRPGAWPLGL